VAKPLLILNPAAARGRARERLRSIAPGEADIATSERPGHAADLAERAGLDGRERVIACGGDGTVHEVVNGLMRLPAEQRPALSVIATGGGNDFAYAVARLPPAAERRIDVAHVADDRGRSAYFANSAGLLFDAAVNARSHRLRLPGFSRYFVATVQSFLCDYRPVDCRLTIDGVTREEALLMLTLGNGPREGGGFYCTPDARLDDGQLDYLAVGAISRARMLALLPRVMRGTHARAGGVHLRLGRFRQLQLEAPVPVPIHLDGELWATRDTGAKNLNVVIVPDALRLTRWG
jgi:diacylglycerol kinase family enzyme